VSIHWQSLGGEFPETSDPAVVSWGPGRLDVFMRGWDNAIWHRWYADGAWGPAPDDWDWLGGDFPATARLAAVSWGSGRIDLCTLGWENAVWHKWYDNGAWGPAPDRWDSLGGDNIRQGYYDFDGAARPALTTWGPGLLDLFVRAKDNTLRHRWFQEGRWHPVAGAYWEYLRGNFVSSPAAVSPRPGRIDVFVRTWEGDLWNKWYDQGAWNWAPDPTYRMSVYDAWAGWETQPVMRYASSPIAVAGRGGAPEAHVFGRGWNDHLVHLWFDEGPNLLGWEDLAGDFVAEPAVVAGADGRFDLFALGTDHMLWHTRIVRQGVPASDPEPPAWTPLGGPFAPNHSPVAVAFAPGQIAVFAVGPDQRVWCGVVESRIDL
jgi:hypothetical protein